MTVPAATARLTFRAWRDDDLPLAMAIWGDPRVAALVGGPFDEAQVRARLATELANQADHGVAYWPVILADGAPAGCAGLRPRDPARRIYELGFYVLPEHWGQGYAAEAGASASAFAFAALAAPAVFAGHHPDNRASRRTLEKLGFRYTHHELYPPTGLEHPCYELRPTRADRGNGEEHTLDVDLDDAISEVDGCTSESSTILISSGRTPWIARAT